ncbi:MAG: hypothetical protein R2684_14110 [Pyrinomonadaceae bacterium]
MIDYWKRLRKKAKRGFRGYPVATIAFYGPDNTAATKVAVGLVTSENSEPEKLERFFVDVGQELRTDPEVGEKVAKLVAEWGARTVGMTISLLGCPHESGIDYPEDTWCPECPFWEERDRFAGSKAEYLARRLMKDLGRSE